MFQKLLMQELRGHTRLIAGLFIIHAFGSMAVVLQAYALAAIVHGAFLEEFGLEVLWPWFVAMLTAAVIKAATSWGGAHLAGQLSAAIKTSLRSHLLTHLFSVGPVYVAQERAGELLHLLGEGMDGIDAYFSKYLPQFVTVLIIPPVILAFTFTVDSTVTAILLVTAPLIPIFMIMIGRWAEQLQNRQWKLFHFLGGHFLDVVTGLTTLKVWGRSREQIEVIARLSKQLRNSTLGVLRVAFLSSLVLELLTTLGTAVIAVAVGLKLLFGQLSFQQAFFVLILTPDFYLPFRHLGSHYHAGLAGITAAERIQELLNISPPDNRSGLSLPFRLERPPSLTFENVSYSYSANRQPALRSFSVSIAPGEHVALVGPSGAGKSTIFDLLMRFIQPQTGEIWVDGHRLCDLSKNDWLSSVSYIPQFPHLFQGTIRDNIRFGSGDEPGRIETAIESSGLEELVRRLPDGLETEIGDGGIALSGGESRRIAIARAFYRDTPLLLMDEAMTSLDPFNESLIQSGIHRLQANRTTLVIAHRPSTAQKADRIIAIEKES